MKMTADRKALDKIYKRRDRYEIPDWQREEVWDDARKRLLIDSILRGWKLPKFYFVRTSPDSFDVVDGQQRLSAIYEFFANKLTLSPESAKQFGGSKYKDLPQRASDDFDDFEIEFDVIEEASDADQKEFFQRVQAGLSLTSSEKLNAVHSKLRDFCRALAKHDFFKDVAIANTRYSHFDIVSKAAVLEIEGLNSGLRFDELKSVFQAQSNFSTNSGVAKRLRSALDLLRIAFKNKGESLRTRTVVQSLITLACRFVETGAANDPTVAGEIRTFFESFRSELTKQVELGQGASDSDYLTFQASVNANVKGGAKTRHQILLRKLFRLSPHLAALFDANIVAESGVSSQISALGESITALVEQLNGKYSATTGEDLIKATNKTASALVRLGKPVKDFQRYGTLIDDLYFLFREGPKARLEGKWPTAFTDVNDLRTDLRHDMDHGDRKKIRAKRHRTAAAFVKYAGEGTPSTLEPSLFPMVQANILAAIESDLRSLLAATPQ
jgi:hypothetical protein